MKTRGLGKFGRPQYNQVAKLVAKFGGESRLARAAGCSRISVYRWGYERPYGSDGLVPSAMVERIQQVARAEGVLLTPHDWLPERIDYTEHTQVHYTPADAVAPTPVTGEMA